jgi:rod shape-determining protein MreC
LRNFILFIRRFFNLILFLGLEVVCIILIARTNMMQGNDIMSSANTIAGIVYQKREDVVYYFGLKKMNDSLLSENLRLHTQLAMLQSVDTLHDSTSRGTVTEVTDSGTIVKYADYRYREARVINNSITAENNYITINRGSADGISRNTAVISGAGAVGKVVHVSAHYASVISILSVKQPVSARLKDGTIGKVIWEVGRPDILVLKDVPPQIKVKKGDSVFTTSYSFFPPDILIGRVIKTKTLRKNNTQLLYLQTAANFRNLQYVYVVENKMSGERVKLEDSTANRP